MADHAEVGGGVAMVQANHSCGLATALAVVGGKWKPLVIWGLMPGPRRFGELRRRIGGISEKMLVQQLRELEAGGVVSRRDFGEVPPRVEYTLTEFGGSLVEALRPLCEWGTTHRERIEAIQEASTTV